MSICENNGLTHQITAINTTAINTTTITTATIAITTTSVSTATALCFILLIDC